MAIFNIKAGADLPILQATLTWPGEPSDLSTVTSVKLRVRPEAGGTTTEFTAAVVSASAKTVKYQWGPSDTATLGAGTFVAEWVVTFVDGSTLILPTRDTCKIIVHAAIAAP